MKESLLLCPDSGKPWDHVKQSNVMKFLQPVMTRYMNLLTLSYLLQYAKRLVT